MTIPDTEALADAWFDSQAGRDGNSYDAYVAGFHEGVVREREQSLALLTAADHACAAGGQLMHMAGAIIGAGEGEIPDELWYPYLAALKTANEAIDAYAAAHVQVAP